MEDNVLFDPQHIVCAVDLSPHSAAVVRAGEFMARMLDARLTVFHAVTIPHDRYPGTTIFERGGEQDDRMTAARRDLHKLFTPLAQAGTAVAAGDPVEMLSGFVRQNAVGLVVAARHGFSGIQRVLLGSVVERMARRLPVPLLVVGRTPAQDHASPLFSHVVAACQTADRRDPVLTTATAVARNFNVGLNLLHAVEQPVQPDLLEPTAGPYGEVQAALQERLHQGFVDTVGAVAEDIRITVDLAPGPAAEVLPRHIRGLKADLLIVGVRPRRGLGPMLMGSTTEAVLRHSSCAVLTVPTTMT
ncbi:MAG: universal stress protein [Desulfobacterales bacterium]|nr:universal stress protein [Desulfobacterales bacterium]